MRAQLLTTGLLATAAALAAALGRDCGAMREAVRSARNAVRTAAQPRPPRRAPFAGVDTMAEGGLFDSYRPVSPHWPHIRTMVTDFRIHYVARAAQRNAELDWTAAHYDAVMGGNGDAYKARNPGLRAFPYALAWTVFQPTAKREGDLASNYYADMTQWYAAHPTYALEDAFLHKPGATKTLEGRLTIKIWDSQRWVINPGDPGARAYQADRLRRAIDDLDGVFIDESSSSDVRGRLGKDGVLEYPGFEGFEEDAVGMLRALREALAPKFIMLNTAEYMRPFDRAMILAAGGAHLERMNSPIFGDMESRWKWIEDLLSHGATVEMVPLNSWEEANKAVGVFRTFTPGEYPTRAARKAMWELASYYMVVPERPDHLLVELLSGWKVPFSEVWLEAQEVNIGHPLEARRIVQRGTDGLGNSYRVWEREFDRALVLVRPLASWREKRFDDSTAVNVPLPTNATWRPLRADGTLGEPVTFVTLRSPEAAIVVREPVTSGGR